MNIEQLRSLIRKDVVEVHFIKKNGENRIMMATTSSDYLSESEIYSSVPSEKFLTVWDIEADGWRSINFEAITLVEWDAEDGTVQVWEP